MHLKFHWAVDVHGVVVAPGPSVSVTLVDANGAPVEDPADYSVAWSDGVHPFPPGSSHLELDVPLGGHLQALRWELRFRQRRLLAGSFHIASRAAGRLRTLALGLLGLILFVALAVSPLEDFGAVIVATTTLLFGGVAIWSQLREAVLLSLFRPGVAGSVVVVAGVLLLLATTQIRKVYNLGLEPVPLRDVRLDARSAAFVVNPEGCFDGVVPHQKADVGWLHWVPWFSCTVGCRAADEPGKLFERSWKKSDHCDPTGLTASIDLKKCLPGGREGELVLRHPGRDQAVNDAAVWCQQSIAGGALTELQFQGLDDFGVDAVGPHDVQSVRYPPGRPRVASAGGSAREEARLLLPARAGDPLEFSFSQGLTPLGKVLVSNSSQTRCAALDGALGVASILLQTASASSPARTLTVIDQPYWVARAPVCFPIARATRVSDLVFAEGWTPETSPGVVFPTEAMPSSLTVRTHVGHWLATLRLHAVDAIRAPLMLRVARLARGTAGHGEVIQYTLHQPVAHTIQVPRSPPNVGTLIWYLADPRAAEPLVLFDGGLPIEHEDVQIDHDAGSAQLHARALDAPDCYFDSTTEEYLSTTRPNGQACSSDDQLKEHGGRQCSRAFRCRSRG